MPVLIVEQNEALATLWKNHLARVGYDVVIARDQQHATELICQTVFRVIILDVVLENGSAIAVADFASYRTPEARIMFVTRSEFFSDGSIFNMCQNACAFLPCATAPSDLACLVQHYAGAAMS